MINARNTAPTITRLAAAALAIAALTGCSGTNSRWSTGHNDLSHQKNIPIAEQRVSVDQVTAQEMRWHPVVEGYHLIATSSFWRDSLIPNDPAASGSELRQHAASIGADYVRWAVIREESPAFSERFRYKAVFYRSNSSPLPMAAMPRSFQPAVQENKQAAYHSTHPHPQDQRPTMPGLADAGMND